MKTRTIISAITASLFAITIHAQSYAQEAALPEGVEVITIVAKRPTPVVASACIDAAIKQATEHQHRDANDARPAGRLQIREAIAQCREQSAQKDQAQI